MLPRDSLSPMSLLRQSIPKDPVDAVAHLDQLQEQVLQELDEARAVAYFDARLDGRFEEALRAGITSRKRALRMVRHLNDRMGRPMRWRDGLDSSSSFRPD